MYIMNLNLFKCGLNRRVTGAVGQPVVGTFYDPSEELPSSKLRYVVVFTQIQILLVPDGPRVESL